MALDSVEKRPDTLPLGDTSEPAPDSSALKVSHKTSFESGIPPARQRESWDLEAGVERLDSALAGVTRTEANLGLLVRGLKHLASGAGAVRDANVELTHELDALRTHLASRHDEEQATRLRMNQLEQLLDVIRHESSRERAFLIEQQDLFLIEIMADHDRQLNELEQQVRQAATRRADAAALVELTTQRDQAREYATRCERERDLAWQELAELGGGERHPTPPNPQAPSGPQLALPHAAPTPAAGLGASQGGATAIGALHLLPIRVPARSAVSADRPATGSTSPGEGEDPDA